MRLITALLTALLIAPLSAYFAYENHARLKGIFEPEKQDIISMISLENACSVPDTAFQVRFKHGAHRAILKRKSAPYDQTG